MLEKYLPKWNTIIKRVLGFSLLFIFATQVLIYFTPFNFIKEFVFLNNVIVVITFFLLFLLGIVSYRKKNPHSKIFLIANSIPFLVAILTAVYTLFYNYHSYTMMYLPYLSIASFTITFSIALAFRNKNIQKELKIKEIETSLLKIENEKNSMIKKSLKEKEVLLKEIHHRVKNNLQVVSSLLGLQSSNIEDENVKKIFAESKNKIQAISLIHQTLYQNKDLAEIDMDEYFKNMYVHILSLFGHEAKKVEFQLYTNNIKFDIDTSVPIALIFNELVTNSLKYAFRDLQGGQLKVELTKLKEGVFCLKVEDNGRGFKTEEMRKNSLGLQLVQMLSSQLNGSFECNSDNGTKISIIFEDTKQRKLAE
jgi:two-component sensor histidine kinase